MHSATVAVWHPHGRMCTSTCVPDCAGGRGLLTAGPPRRGRDFQRPACLRPSHLDLGRPLCRRGRHAPSGADRPWLCGTGRTDIHPCRISHNRCNWGRCHKRWSKRDGRTIRRLALAPRRQLLPPLSTRTRLIRSNPRASAKSPAALCARTDMG